MLVVHRETLLNALEAAPRTLTTAQVRVYADALELLAAQAWRLAEAATKAKLTPASPVTPKEATDNPA